MYNQQTRLLRLVKGLHGLHVYATEYWTEYLLASVASRGSLQGSGKLLSLASQFTEALEKMADVALPKWQISSGSTDDRLSLLNPYEKIQKQVEHALLARSQKQLEFELFQGLCEYSLHHSLSGNNKPSCK